MRILAQKLKELRYDKQLNQTDVAKNLGIGYYTLGKWEQGRAEPSAEDLVKLADFYGCSVDYLLGREDDFGNVTVYQQTDALSSLSANEQKIIDALRRKAPKNAMEWLTMYAELPPYMQESIFAELKGMHLGYTVSKNKNTVEG